MINDLSLYIIFIIDYEIIDYLILYMSLMDFIFSSHIQLFNNNNDIKN